MNSNAPNKAQSLSHPLISLHRQAASAYRFGPAAPDGPYQSLGCRPRYHPGPRRCMGFYECPCGAVWRSAHTWAGRGQGCIARDVFYVWLLLGSPSIATSLEMGCSCFCRIFDSFDVPNCSAIACGQLVAASAYDPLWLRSAIVDIPASYPNCVVIAPGPPPCLNDNLTQICLMARTFFKGRQNFFFLKKVILKRSPGTELIPNSGCR